MANRYSYGYQMMKKSVRKVSREEVEENKENVLSSRKPISVKTTTPRMPPGQGLGTRRKLFDGPREERLARPSQEDIQRLSKDQGPSGNDPPPSEERLVSQEDIFSESQSQIMNGPPPPVPQNTPSQPPDKPSPLTLPEDHSVSQRNARILGWLRNETEVSDQEKDNEEPENTVTAEIPEVAENVETKSHEIVHTESTESTAPLPDVSQPATPLADVSQPPAPSADVSLPPAPSADVSHPPAPSADVSQPQAPSPDVPATQNTIAEKKSNYKNVKVARKQKRDNPANAKNYTRKKKSFLDKLGTIFSKSEDLHKSLGETPDWIVAFKDSVHKESRHGQSIMANKYICLGEGPIFEKFLQDHLSYNSDEHFVVLNYDNFNRRHIQDRSATTSTGVSHPQPPAPSPEVSQSPSVPDLSHVPSSSATLSTERRIANDTSNSDKKRVHESSSDDQRKTVFIRNQDMDSL